jgi:hypothetical protein
MLLLRHPRRRQVRQPHRRHASEARRPPRPARQPLAGRRRLPRPPRRALVSRDRPALGVGRWTRTSCEHSHVIHHTMCCMPQHAMFVECQCHVHHRCTGLACVVPHRVDDGRVLSRAKARPAQFDDTPELCATISPGDPQNRSPRQHSLQHRFVRASPPPPLCFVLPSGVEWEGCKPSESEMGRRCSHSMRPHPPRPRSRRHRRHRLRLRRSRVFDATMGYPGEGPGALQSILTCNSTTWRNAVQHLQVLSDSDKPQVVCIQELRLEQGSEDDRSFRTSMWRTGYQVQVSYSTRTGPRGLSGGVAIAWLKTMDVCEHTWCEQRWGAPTRVTCTTVQSRHLPPITIASYYGHVQSIEANQALFAALLRNFA